MSGLVLVSISIGYQCTCSACRDLPAKQCGIYARTLSDIVDSNFSSNIREYATLDIEDGDARFDFEVRNVKRTLEDAIAYCAHPARAWMSREDARIRNGTYKRVPERIYNSVDFPFDHYVHLPAAAGDTDKIAFTESPERGMQDKQTVMSFGRYLKRYFPDMSDTDIAALVTRYRSARVPEVLTLHFATDAETINEIFETKMSAQGAGVNFHSCMYGKFASWATRPYHVYADSPDVAVAYARNAEGDIVARSVVSTARERWVRAYAVHTFSDKEHESRCAKLIDLLENFGYGKGSLSRARLSKVYDTHGTVIAPYLDGDCCGLEDNGQYWRVVSEGEGEYDAHEVDGYPTECENRFECCYCDFTSLSEDDITSDDNNGRTYCNACYEELYVSAIYNARGRETYVNRDDAMEDCDGVFYTRDYGAEYLIYREDEYHTPECSHLEITCAHCDYTSTDEDEFDFDSVSGNYYCNEDSQSDDMPNDNTCDTCAEFIQNERARKEVEREKQLTLIS